MRPADVTTIPYNTAPLLPTQQWTRWVIHEAAGSSSFTTARGGRPPEWEMPDQPYWPSRMIGLHRGGGRSASTSRTSRRNIPDTTTFVSVHGIANIPHARSETRDHVSIR